MTHLNAPNPPVRKTPRANNGGISATTSRYRSNCKICGWSIHDEPAHWSRKPLGLVHDTCQTEE